jgi:hypothetical protein
MSFSAVQMATLKRPKTGQDIEEGKQATHRQTHHLTQPRLVPMVLLLQMMIDCQDAAAPAMQAGRQAGTAKAKAKAKGKRMSVVSVATTANSCVSDAVRLQHSTQHGIEVPTAELGCMDGWGGCWVVQDGWQATTCSMQTVSYQPFPSTSN